MTTRLFSLISAIFVLTFLPAMSRAADQVAGDSLSTQQPLYVPTTVPNLARSYWLLSKLDPENNSLIDQYLMISECTLFTQFFKDDFEWNKIRDATRGYIKANKSLFPKRFEFVQPIYLDRYDFDKGGFAIIEKYRISGASKMFVSGNDPEQYPCTKRPGFSKRDFPMNAILNMDRPLTYAFVKTDKEMSEEYLKYIQTNKVSTRLGRPAYIRYRFKVAQILGSSNFELKEYANLFGALESISVFGDKEMLIKLDEMKF